MRIVTVSSGAIISQGPTSTSLAPASDSHGRPEILARTGAAAPSAPCSRNEIPRANPPPTASVVTTNCLRLISGVADMSTSHQNGCQTWPPYANLLALHLAPTFRLVGILAFRSTATHGCVLL